ncbi:hypothetical protein GRX01_10845 [Halobaculum sp. WSA2]|uniref:DUF7979 domain-containing protein n=1 Tax=Halobaculum saliterrae TaxID=2073113 RepID=A0A6B0T0R0_9EURY|nr:hypothetical protein [Halobaculum saliterrae]MXR41830.1 hypothetical protein [Halobaculum saliterrae]
MSPRRRSLLVALGGLGSTAATGCLGDAPTESPDGDPSATGATETDPSGEPDGDNARAADTLRLAVADGFPADGPVRVHSGPLASLLERGATTGDRVRATDSILLTGRPPLLPGERTVTLAGDGVDDGAYELAVDGGLLYDWLLGATAVDDPPRDVDVVDVDALPNDRRSLAVEAIRGGRATVEPQTPLGTWARTEFVDGYVRREGTVYRGYERRQTDAAFFSEEVWYVASVTPTEGASSDAPTLHLDPLPSAARTVVDDLLADWASTLDPVEADVSDLDDRARRALAGTDRLLTHVAVFEVDRS